MEIKVVSTGLFRISGCDYPVIKIEHRNTVQGVTIADFARYYHAASMIPLRTTISQFAAKLPHPKTIEFIATSAEKT